MKTKINSPKINIYSVTLARFMIASIVFLLSFISVMPFSTVFADNDSSESEEDNTDDGIKIEISGNTDPDDNSSSTSSNSGSPSTVKPTQDPSNTDDSDTDSTDDVVIEDGNYTFGTNSITLYAGWKKYYSEIFGTTEDASITYRSKNEKIASVSEDGIITPVSIGKTRIFADITVKGKTNTCSVKVTVKEPYSIVTDSINVMTCDSYYTFKLKRFGHCEQVLWTLSGEGLAELEAESPTDCTIHTLAPGNVTLTAECRGESFSFNIKIYHGTGTLFIISPSSDPYKGYYKSYSTYSKKTKGYYLLRSYLERLDKIGGGVLVLKKGTYTVTNTLCVPSNTTIILEDGAKILKSDDTGTSNLTATASLFQTVSYTNAAKEGVFKGYKGEHDISFIGEGNATIDLNCVPCQGIAAAHCKNLTISGLSFKNMNTYHFIELAGNANVTVSGNYFYGFSESKTTRKEAINIDAPDKETHGFTQYWTSYDKTPNKNIYITDNVFYNVECGIGTHKYSEGSTHKNMNILRNTFIDSNTYSIRCMNWDNPVIKDNVFTYTVPSDYAEIAIICNGVKDPKIYDNLFDNLVTPISFYHWKNTGKGNIYAPIYNELNQTSIELLQKNTLTNVTNPYFEYYVTLDDFSDSSLEIHLIQGDAQT